MYTSYDQLNCVGLQTYETPLVILHAIRKTKFGVSSKSL